MLNKRHMHRRVQTARWWSRLEQVIDKHFDLIFGLHRFALCVAVMCIHRSRSLITDSVQFSNNNIFVSFRLSKHDKQVEFGRYDQLWPTAQHIDHFARNGSVITVIICKVPSTYVIWRTPIIKCLPLFTHNTRRENATDRQRTALGKNDTSQWGYWVLGNYNHVDTREMWYEQTVKHTLYLFNSHWLHLIDFIHLFLAQFVEKQFQETIDALGIPLLRSP